MTDRPPIEQHSTPSAERHRITRVRRDTRRRHVTVTAVETLSPRMKRIAFTSPDLSDFDSSSHDDHVKLFFAAGDTAGAANARDFTPRTFDRATQRLEIDFVLHAHGPATTWARGARIGDTLEIGGPRGSMVVADDFDWYLLIGDESALPAIGRRVEELRAGVPVTTVVAIADGDERQSLTTPADWRPHWVYRDHANADDNITLVRRLEDIDAGTGDGFVWIAAETSVARAVRQYMLDRRRHPAAWLKAAAYWTRGRAGEHEGIDAARPG
jgi:NADPH-dependent ferric siderophore reductase